MIKEKNKKYLFNAEQAPFLEDIKGFIFSELTEVRESHLKSDFFKNTPYHHGICIQIDKEKLSPTCNVPLIHEALASLENNPAHGDLVKALRSYLKLNPKIKRPIDANSWKKVGQFVGMMIGGIGSICSLAALASIVPLGITFPILLTIIATIAVLIIVSIMLGRYIGELLGSQIASHMNKNRIQSNLEENLKQRINQNNEHNEEASKVPDECLMQRMDRIPTYLSPSNDYRYK